MCKVEIQRPMQAVSSQTEFTNPMSINLLLRLRRRSQAAEV